MLNHDRATKSITPTPNNKASNKTQPTTTPTPQTMGDGVVSFGTSWIETLEPRVLLSTSLGPTPDLHSSTAIDHPHADHLITDPAADQSIAVDPDAFTATGPTSGLIYQKRDVPGEIQFLIPAEQFEIDIDPGQTLSVRIKPSPTLQPKVELLDTDGQLVAMSAAPFLGARTSLQTAKIQGGLYTVRISGDGGSVGTFTADFVINAALDQETTGGTSNNTLRQAQNLDASFISLGGTAQRGAAIGRLSVITPETEPTPIPSATNLTDEPNDTLGTAAQSGIGPGAASTYTDSGFIGDNPAFTIGTNGLDVDLIRVDLLEGDEITADIDASAIGSTLDPILRLFDSAGAQITFNDDTHGLDSFIRTTVPSAGTYYVGVSGFSNFSYDPSAPGSGSIGDTGFYELSISVDSEAIPPGTGDALEEDFESGTLGSQWTTRSSSATGRIRVTGDFGAADGSGQALLMDSTSSFFSTTVLNEAIWTVDLSDKENAKLNFWHASWGVLDDDFGGDFTGSFEADGIAISNDGLHWHPVFIPFHQPDGEWHPYEVDLSLHSRAAGMPLGEGLQIKFQQFVRGGTFLRQRGFDQIQITANDLPNPDAEDWYSFSLDQDESATLRLKGHATVQLYNEHGELLSEGTATGLIDRTIDDFTAPEAGTFYARISDAGVEDYALVVTRNTTFDSEPNNNSEVAQPIAPSGIALGHVGTPGAGGNLGRLFANDLLNGNHHEIDLETGDALSTFPFVFPDTFNLFTGLATTEDSVLVDGPNSVDIQVRNPDTFELIRTIPNPGVHTKALAYNAGELFLLSDENRQITVIDYQTGDVLRTIVPGPGLVRDGLAALGENLIGSDGETLYQIDPITGRTTGLGTLPINPEFYNAIGVVNDVLFVNGGGSSLTALDLATLEILHEDSMFLDGLTSLGADSGAVIDPDTADHYSITAESGDTLTINASAFAAGPGVFANNLDLAVELFNPDGESIAFGADGAITHIVAAPGVYTVSVTAQDDTQGEYTLSVTADVIEQLAINEFERLEPLGGLILLSEDNTGSIPDSDHINQYEFFLDGGQSISAVARPDNPSALLSLQLNGITYTAPEPGEPVVLPASTIGGSETVVLQISADTNTNYSLDVYRNASLEAQAGDSEDGNEVPIDGSRTDQGSGRFGVIGSSTPFGDIGVIFSENFDSGSTDFVFDNSLGSFGGGLWHLSNGRSLDGLENHSPPGSLYYGQDEGPFGGGNYETSFDENSGAAFSPSITLPASGPITLTFNHFLETENASIFDISELAIDDGTGFTTLLSSSDGTIPELGTSGLWQNISVDLTEFAGNDITLRWSFDTIDGAFNDFEGWYIDDITITGPVIDVTEEPVLYGAAGAGGFGGSEGVLYQINPLTGEADSIGPIGFTGVTGMTFLNDGRLVASAVDGPFGDQAILIEIDPLTGAGTLIGNLIDESEDGIRRMPDLGYDTESNTLYGYGRDDVDGLYIIDPNTAQSTLIGPTGASGSGNGLDVDPTTGTIYATPSGTDSLVTLNPLTGEATDVPGSIGAVLSPINALDFHPLTGVLFGSFSDAFVGGVSSLVTIDTHDGTTTVIGDTVLGLDALAWGPEATGTVLLPTDNEPNNIIPDATPTGIGISANHLVINGEIGNNPEVFASDDVDLYRVDLAAGDRITVDIDADTIGSPLDSMLRVFSSDGTQVAGNDDVIDLDSFIDFTAAFDDTYYVGVSSFSNFFYDPFIQGSGDGDGSSSGFYQITFDLTPSDLTADDLATDDDPLTVTVNDIEHNLLASSYSTQDQPEALLIVEDDGATIGISGNGWKKVVFDAPITITENTILSFDFTSPMLAELQGVGFDNDDDVANEGTIFFQVAGTDSAFPNLVTDFADYPRDGSIGDTVHYDIPIGQHLTGDFTFLTFFNDHDVPPHLGESLFSNITISEVTDLTVTVNDAVQHLEVSPYSTQNDPVSIAEIDDLGATLHLAGNAWWKIAFDAPITVTESTTLSFDYSSAALAELQGIGLDSDDDVTNEGTIFFQVAGTDSAFPNLVTDFADYPQDGLIGDVVHYQIPLGQFVTGEFDFLTFFNDDDVAPQDGQSTFSNIQIFEQPLAITVNGATHELNPTGYSTQDDPESEATVVDAGASVRLNGNAWKKLTFDTPLTITPNTLLKFDFSSSMLAELQGIGFDNDDDVTNEGTIFFQVAGTDSAFPNLVTDFADYPRDGLIGDTVHYEIPLGDFITGEFNFITLFNDDDIDPQDGVSLFSNIELFEHPLTITVHGTDLDQPVTSYSTQDDPESTAKVDTAGNSLQITGNGWKKVTLDEPVTVAEHTVLRFDFSSATLAELQGIGLDNDDDVTNEGTILFQVTGTDTEFPNIIRDFADYPLVGTLGDTIRYEIPIGLYTTGDFTSLTFFNDHDSDPKDGTSTFTNIEIFDSTPPLTDLDEYTLELNAGDRIDVVLAGQDGADFASVIDSLSIDAFETYDPATDNPLSSDDDSTWQRDGDASAGNVIAIDDDRVIAGAVSGLYPLRWWSPFGARPQSASARFQFDAPRNLEPFDTVSFTMKSDRPGTSTTARLVLTNGINTYQSRTSISLSSSAQAYAFGLDESSFELIESTAPPSAVANFNRTLAATTQIGFTFNNTQDRGSEAIVFDDFKATDQRVVLELLDTDGQSVLATAANPTTGSGNYDQAILGFTTPADGRYTLRLTSGVSGDYGLVVTDALAFDTEPNSQTTGTVRSLDDTAGSLGYLGDEPPIVDGTLFGSSRNGNLFSIDLSTGETTLVGFLPSESTEIECDIATGQCFSQLPDDSSQMLQYDITTGDQIGSTVSNGLAFNGLEFVDGVLFGTAIPFTGEPSDLRTLNPLTGASTHIGFTGRGPIAGLAWDTAAGVMYGIEGGGGPASLLTINLTTGAATTVGSTGIQAGSLEFGPNGQLYAGGTGANSGELHLIDPTTGATTLIGFSDFGSITGLTLGPPITDFASTADDDDLGGITAGIAEPWIAPFDDTGVSQRIVVVDDPSLHEIGPGEGFDGVVDLTINRIDGTVGCSGALLATGEHILTAAHCIADDFGGGLIATGGTVRFDMPTGPVNIAIDSFFVHPDYNGNTLNGFDIAIIKLTESAPIAAERYDIYRSSDEVGQLGLHVGYGWTGLGGTGDVPGSGGTKRAGDNRYDALADVWDDFVFSNGFAPNINPGTQLAFDFDSGLASTDAFGSIFGIGDLGEGTDEINSAPGDSGGPVFIDGLIAGVTSWGFTPGVPPDVTFGVDSSFGEFSSDTRVSIHADWIDEITGSTSLSGPTVLAIDPPAGTHNDEITTIQIEFSETITTDSATDPDNYNLLHAGPNGLFEGGTNDDVTIELTPEFDGDREVQLLINAADAPLPSGHYQLTIDGGSSIVDLDGNPLNSTTGPGGGSDHVHEFEIEPAPITGGDIYEITLTRNQLLLLNTQTPLSSDGPNTLDPHVTVFGADGTPLAQDDNSASDGRNAALSFIAPQDGVYRVQVSAAAGEGEYTLNTEVFDPLKVVIESTIITASQSETVSGFVDVHFEVPEPLLASLSAYNVELSLNTTDSVLSILDVIEADNPIFPGQAPQLFDSPDPGNVLRVGDSLLDFGTETPILDAQDLFRVLFEVAPGFVGTFDIGIDATQFALFDGLAGQILPVEVVTGQVSVIDPGPQVVEVLISGSDWSPAVLNEVDPDHGIGFPIPVGSPDQLVTLPWVNIDQVSVRFNESVDVQITDLALHGVSVSQYAISGLAYDPSTFTATWTIDLPTQPDGTVGIGPDNLLINLFEGITDLGGNALDGEWVNPLPTAPDSGDTFPSGDGAAGGNFQFGFNVLPGNVDEPLARLQDQPVVVTPEVLTNDVLLIRNAQFNTPGDPGYSAFLDVNANATIFGDDLILTRNRLFSERPTGEPAAPNATFTVSDQYTLNLSSATLGPDGSLKGNATRFASPPFINGVTTDASPFGIGWPAPDITTVLAWEFQIDDPDSMDFFFANPETQFDFQWSWTLSTNHDDPDGPGIPASLSINKQGTFAEFFPPDGTWVPATIHFAGLDIDVFAITGIDAPTTPGLFEVGYVVIASTDPRLLLPSDTPDGTSVFVTAGTSTLNATPVHAADFVTDTTTHTPAFEPIAATPAARTTNHTRQTNTSNSTKSSTTTIPATRADRLRRLLPVLSEINQPLHNTHTAPTSSERLYKLLSSPDDDTLGLPDLVEVSDINLLK